MLLRRLIRMLGLGRLWLAITHVRHIGVRKWTRLLLARRTYLPRIEYLPPLNCDPTGVEVHMLLHHAALLQGMWAYYSFAFYTRDRSQLFIHDDGSLTADDVARVLRLFPGASVIRRDVADERMARAFAAKRLPLCKKLRETLVFGLKLFDVVEFARNDVFILLDSDVLFFRRPIELLDGGKAPRFGADNGYRYSLATRELGEVAGLPVVDAFNSGLVRVNKEDFSFDRVEGYLAHPGFWEDGSRANYFAEQTIWAMEMSRAGAHPLPDSYAIAPVVSSAVTFGHYCGGIASRALYFLSALPTLFEELSPGRSTSL